VKRVLVVLYAFDTPDVNRRRTGRRVLDLRAKGLQGNLALVVSRVRQSVIDYEPTKVVLHASDALYGLLRAMVSEEFPGIELEAVSNG